MNIHNLYNRKLSITLSFCTAAALLSPLPAAETPSSSAGARSSSSSMTLEKRDREFLVRAAVLGQEEIRLSQLAVTRATNPQVREFAQKLVTDHQMGNAKLLTLASTKGIMLTGLDAGAAPGSRTRMGSSPAAGSSSATTPSTTTPSTTPRTGSSSATSPTPGSTYAGAADPKVNEEVAEDIKDGLEDIRDKEAKLAEKTGTDFDKAYLEYLGDCHETTIDLFSDASRRTDSDSQITAFATEQLTKLQEHQRRVTELGRAVGA